MYLITSYENAQQDIGRKADKNRKIYNGMMKTYFISIRGQNRRREQSRKGRQKMKQIIFATGNAGKMKEIREILDGTGWNVLSLKDAGIDTEIEENGTTFEENAKIKAEGIRNWCLETGFRAAAGFRRKKLLCLRMIPDWKSTGWAESRAFILRAIWGMKPLTVKKRQPHQPSGRRPERKAHSTFCLCYCSSPVGRKQSCDARNDRGLYRLGRVRQQRIWI